MTREQKIEAFSMRLDGHSLQEIGDKYGVSRQYIYQMLNGCGEKKGKCIFPNLKEWMTQKKESAGNMAGKLEISKNAMSMKLRGKSALNMKEIKGILEITGMTFEECFEEAED